MNDSPLSLAGVWKLRAADERKPVPCPIPGDNYSALKMDEVSTKAAAATAIGMARITSIGMPDP